MDAQNARAAAVQAAASYLNGTAATVEDVVCTADIFAAYIQGGFDAARDVGIAQGRGGPEFTQQEVEALAGAGSLLDGPGGERELTELLRQARVSGAPEVLVEQLQRLGSLAAPKVSSVPSAQPSAAPASTPTPPSPPSPPAPSSASRAPEGGGDAAYARKLASAALKAKNSKQVLLALTRAKEMGVVRKPVPFGSKEVPLVDMLRALYRELSAQEKRSEEAKSTPSPQMQLA